jgi:peroxiredoxin Q/BCP
MEKATLNKPVPDFTASATGGQDLRLSDYRGKYLVLYFYPKDHTPGCTQEGQAFRDHYQELQSLNAVILGVSRDSLKTHENFKAKQELPFDLIADTEEKLCGQFDVIKMKNMYGKQVRGVERSTFLIDKNGVLIREWRKVKVNGHSEAILKALAELPES